MSGVQQQKSSPPPRLPPPRILAVYIMLLRICRFLLFVPILFLWFIVMPVIAVVVCAVGRALLRSCRMSDSEMPYWLDTPWDMLTNMAAQFWGVRIRDCDGQHSLLLPGIRKMRCVILVNHRSWGDFFIDPAMGHCAVVSRLAAVLATCIAGFVGLWCRRVIIFHRGKDSRQELSAKCEAHERYLFYPEGTRRAAQPNADEPIALKMGGIKNIFEAKRPALINICVNKEVSPVQASSSQRLLTLRDCALPHCSLPDTYPTARDTAPCPTAHRQRAYRQH